ncbi:hypothetical protein CSA56_05670 [candidate division KSB3 bacterium]|uniref:Uncharacterized protein n=1 Tax=candidate division KSB3 bacterium TaxID=2044937 RepID=A0A2G6KHE0_9BACT|nr:MAG: hypothetical protein CSA56_05670 [candidate division KSB3 bacterium]
MKQCISFLVVSLLLFAGHAMICETLLAQEPSSESLRLPEVVITGTDQSKIQRILPKVTLPHSSLPLVLESSHDEAGRLIAEANLLALIQPEKAIPLYREAITQNPTDSLGYHRLADAYRASGQYDEALNTYQHALDRANSPLEAHYQLGMLYETLFNDPQKAIEHYQLYIKRGGTDPRVRLWLRNMTRRESQAVP